MGLAEVGSAGVVGECIDGDGIGAGHAEQFGIGRQVVLCGHRVHLYLHTHSFDRRFDGDMPACINHNAAVIGDMRDAVRIGQRDGFEPQLGAVPARIVLRIRIGHALEPCGDDVSGPAEVSVSRPSSQSAAS